MVPFLHNCDALYAVTIPVYMDIDEGLETAHVSYTFVRRNECAFREVANWLLIGL